MCFVLFCFVLFCFVLFCFVLFEIVRMCWRVDLGSERGNLLILPAISHVVDTLHGSRREIRKGETSFFFCTNI